MSPAVASPSLPVASLKMGHARSLVSGSPFPGDGAYHPLFRRKLPLVIPRSGTLEGNLLRDSKMLTPILLGT